MIWLLPAQAAEYCLSAGRKFGSDVGDQSGQQTSLVSDPWFSSESLHALVHDVSTRLAAAVRTKDLSKGKDTKGAHKHSTVSVKGRAKRPPPPRGPRELQIRRGACKGPSRQSWRQVSQLRSFFMGGARFRLKHKLLPARKRRTFKCKNGTL